MGGRRIQARRNAARGLTAAALVLGIALLPVAASSQTPAPPADAPAARGQGTDATPGAAKGGEGAQRGAPKLRARAWVLIDPLDGTVLASKAADRRLPIASATKLMTAHLALKKLKPGERLTAPPYKALPAESLLDLRAGEKMTVRDLLYGLVLESGNDAAVTLAEGVSGSVPRFVEAMNRQAEALGLDNTSFANPIGLDDRANYSSANDLAALARVLLENRLFARISDTGSALLKSGDRPRRLSSRNLLLGRDPTIDGVKTGHTIQAGYVLVGSATRGGTRLISAVLGAGSEAGRDAETLKLLDYGFGLYRSERPVSEGEELADPKLDFRDERLALLAKRAIVVSAREGQEIETAVEAPDEVSGEIEAGEPLGEVVVTVDGREAASSPLVAASSADAASLVDKAVATAQNPLILLPGGAFVIVVGLLLATRRRRHHDDDNEPDEPSPPRRRERGPQQRTPEERRKMQEERIRRRQQRATGPERPR
jgi:D-alanyl-D-alanine carboxypeptidase (penicillin-binding protein 5/6)